MTGVANTVVQWMPLPANETDNIGPGCYVKVQDGTGCYWAEITHGEGDTFVGRVHNELATPQCHRKSDSTTKVVFDRNQVVDLGCDNYCWC